MAAPEIDSGSKAALLCCLVPAINLTWMPLGRVLARMMRDPVRSRILNVVFAVLLVASTAAAFL